MGTFFNGVQAACAVIALWFGYAAYTSWSSQEAAKRNADFAMEVLKAGYAAEKCFEGSRISTMSKNYDRREILKIASEGEAKLAECSSQFSQFAAFAFIAERSLDKETSEAINAYAEWLQKNSHHFGMLKSFAGLPANYKVVGSKGEETREEAMLRVLEEAGAIVFDPDAYSSDEKAKIKGEEWNKAARERRLERSMFIESYRIRRRMNERLTHYVRLKVAH